MTSLLFFWSSVIGFDLLILCEYLYDRRAGRGLYHARDAWASISMYWGYVLVYLLWAGGVYAIYDLLYSATPLRLEASWSTFAALFVLEDLCFYAYHRTSHRVRLLWAAHVNHHSSEDYNLTTALRQTWTPFLGIVFWLPLPLLGFRPEWVLAAQALSLLYQSFLHTQVFDGPGGVLGWLFNTPSHHRVHHGTNPEYIDKNFGGVLIVWDRLFGSFEPEAAPVRYGITKPVGSYNPLRIAFHEYGDILRDLALARGLREGFGRLLAPPGWQPPDWQPPATQAASAAPVARDPVAKGVENNLAIIFLHSVVLFWLVFFSRHWWPIENFAWLVLAGLALSPASLALLPAGAEWLRRCLAALLAGALLAFPVLLPYYFEANRALTIVSASLAVYFAFKILAYVRAPTAARPRALAMLYFLIFTPEMDCRRAFRSGPQQGLPRKVVRGLLLLATGALVLYLLLGGVLPLPTVASIYIPLGWYAAGASETGFWLLHALKAACIYSLLRGWLSLADGTLRLGALGPGLGRRSPLWAAHPAAFWRRLYPGFFRPLPWALPLAGLGCEYFLWAAAGTYRPGFALAFFLLQAILSRPVRRLARLNRTAGRLVQWSQLALASTLFFRAWDGLFG